MAWMVRTAKAGHTPIAIAARGPQGDGRATCSRAPGASSPRGSQVEAELAEVEAEGARQKRQREVREAEQRRRQAAPRP